MKIFISYRRQDSEWITTSLFNELKKHFSEQDMFKDISTIKAGEDYSKAIETNLKSCDVLLVVIAKDWLQCKDESGNQRIFKSDDPVRMEIETAIRFGKKIIPLLPEGVQMPSMNELPQSIAELHKMQLMRFSQANFDTDVFNIANAIHNVTGNRNEYSDLLKDFVSGKVSQKEMVKPESNSAYALVCAVFGLLVFWLNSDDMSIGVVGIGIAAAGGVAYLFSTRVKSLWLGKKFDEARSQAKRTKLISLISPGVGIVIILFVILAQFFSPEGQQSLNEVQNLINTLQQDTTAQQNNTLSEEDNSQQQQTVQPSSTTINSAYETASRTEMPLLVTIEPTVLFTQPSIEGITLTPIMLGTEFQALDTMNGFALGDFYDADGQAYRGWVPFESIHVVE